MKTYLVAFCLLTPLLLLSQEFTHRKKFDSIVKVIKSMPFTPTVFIKTEKIDSRNRKVRYQFKTDKKRNAFLTREFSNQDSMVRQQFIEARGQLIYSEEMITSYFEKDSIRWGGQYYFEMGKLKYHETLGHGKSEIDTWDPQTEVLRNYRTIKKAQADYLHEKSLRAMYADTILLLKDTVNGKVQLVYIDKNRESIFYNDLLPPKSISPNDASYQSSIEYLKETDLDLIPRNPIVPWKAWVPLYQYKGGYYVYKPCDGINNFAQTINDSLFIEWSGEGAIGNQISSVQKIDSKTYLFGLNGEQRQLSIHVIDQQKGIAVFEDTGDYSGEKYHLMIAAEKISSVPIIINYCHGQKQREFQFETPDFKTLLDQNLK